MQVLGQVNNCLVLRETKDGEKPATMHEALNVLESDLGVNNVSKLLTASYSKYEFAYDISANRFVLLQGDKIAESAEGYEKETTAGQKYNFWKFSSDISATDEYSHYCEAGYVADIVTCSGVDVGNNDIVSVTYTNNDADKDVIIRTNSDATTLKTVDTNNGSHVKQYGDCGIIEATVAMNSMEINGDVGYLEVKTQGHIIVNGSVELVYTEITNKESILVEGNVEHGHAISDEAAESLNSSTNSIQWDYDGDTDSSGKHPDGWSLDSEKEEVAGEAISASVANEKTEGGSQKYVARIGTKGYVTFEDAVTDAQNKSVRIVLLDNIGLTEYYQISKDCPGYVCNLEEDTLDLNGYTITNNNHGVDYKLKNSKIMNGSFVAANGGSYAICITGSSGSSYESVLENLNCTGGINCCNSKVRIKGGEISRASGTIYYAIWADVLATIYVEGGTYTSPSILGGCVLNTVSGDKTSKIIILGGEYNANGTTEMFAASSNITIVGGTFNKDPQSKVSSNCSSTYDAVKCVWNVSAPEGKTVLVYADQYSIVELLVNNSDLNEEGKLISGEYVVYTDAAINEFVAKGYTAIGSSWSGYVILKTEGSSDSSGSVASLSYKGKSIYYKSFETCLKEAKALGVNTITINVNTTINGNLDGSMNFNGSYYTLTVNGSISGGTFGCKVDAQAISGGTFNAAVTVLDGGISGGSFKNAIAANKVASGKYVSYDNNLFVVASDISSFEAYYELNGYNVYGAYSAIYSKGNLTLLKDVTATVVSSGKVITLNGHVLTLNLSATSIYTVIFNNSNTKGFVVKKLYVNNGQLYSGMFANSINVADFPIASGYEIVTYSTYDCIVKSDDLDVSNKVYKGVYLYYDVNNILAEGYSSASVTIESSTYYVVGKDIKTFNNKVVAGIFNFDPTTYVDTNNAIISENDGVWTVTIDETKCVAQVGENKYLSFADAYNAVSTNGEVKLLGNISLSGSEDLYLSKAFTLNLNGFTITSTATCSLFRTYNYSDNYAITVKNGTINATNGLVNLRGATITMIDVNVTCGSIGSFNGSSTNKGKLIVVSGTFNKDVTSYVATGSSISESEGTWTVIVDAD